MAVSFTNSILLAHIALSIELEVSIARMKSVFETIVL